MSSSIKNIGGPQQSSLPNGGSQIDYGVIPQSTILTFGKGSTPNSLKYLSSNIAQNQLNYVDPNELDKQKSIKGLFGQAQNSILSNKFGG